MKTCQNMTSFGRFSFVTKCLAVIVAMASLPIGTKGLSNDTKNNSMTAFQEGKITIKDIPIGL